MKRSRPQGLGAGPKKLAMEEEEMKSSEAQAKIMFELPEDATALDQVKALYDAALMVLDDEEKSGQLLNGVVNECIRLENIKDSELGEEVEEGSDEIDGFVQVKKDAPKIFVSDFYFIFGDCLRILAEFCLDSMLDTKQVDQVVGLLSVASEKLKYSMELSKNENPSGDVLKTLIIVSSLLQVLCGSEDYFEDVKELIGEDEDLRTVALISTLDALEAKCNFIEECDSDLLDKNEEVSNILDCVKNLDMLVSESDREASIKVDIVKIDIPLRLALLDSETLTEDFAQSSLAQLNRMLQGFSEDEVKFKAEVLMLKGSILELQGKEDEANECYSAAEKLEPDE